MTVEKREMTDTNVDVADEGRCCSVPLGGPGVYQGIYEGVCAPIPANSRDDLNLNPALVNIERIIC